MIDDSRAQAYQALYLIFNDSRALGELYKECVVIANARLGVYLKRKHLQLQSYRFEEVAHQAATYLIEYYLRKPTYVVQHFATRLSQEILRTLHTRHGKDAGEYKWERFQHIQLNEEDHLEIPAPLVRKPSYFAPRKKQTIDGIPQLITCYDREELVGNILTEIKEDHPQGARIIVDIYRASTYTDAIKAIAKYVRKQWIYDHALRLEHLFNMTRRRYAKESK